eukprot:COSAG04_NODE_2146_length_4697_cov_1.957590_3_plen_162_part_01
METWSDTATDDAKDYGATLKKVAVACAAGTAILLMILGVYFTTAAQTIAPPPDAAMVMRSEYNQEVVQAVQYTGPPTALTWELQHSLCAEGRRLTPGSDISGNPSDPYGDGSDHLHGEGRYFMWKPPAVPGNPNGSPMIYQGPPGTLGKCSHKGPGGHVYTT